MPIDPNIALSFRGMQVADPLAQYGQVQNILAAQTQRQAAGTQNELAQVHLGQARMTLQQAQEAHDYVTQVMAKAKENGAPTDDPMEAAMQMLRHPNPQVQAAGGHLLDSAQKVLAYQQQAQFLKDQSPDAAAGPTATDLAPITPENAFTAPVSRGTQANALAAPAATSVNAMATSQSLAAKINEGDRKYGNASGWLKQRELLVDEYKQLIKPEFDFKEVANADGTISYQAINKRTAQAQPVTSGGGGSLSGTNIPAQRLQFDKDKQAYEQANPGKEIKEVTNADGTVSVLAIDKRTGVATPVTMGTGNVTGVNTAAQRLQYEKDNPGKTVHQVNNADGSVSFVAVDNKTGIATPVTMGASAQAAPVPAQSQGQGQPLMGAKVNAPPSMVAEYTFAKTPDGGNFKGSYQQFVTARAEAGRAPAQPQPPVAVVDPVTGKQVYVTREEALSKKMTPANAMEGLAPKEIQKREAAYPQATTAVKAIEKSTDSLVKDMQTLRDHPGLDSITGIAAGRLPAITANGRAAQALYDKIVAKGGFQMLQDIRDASKTGGALGNLSNQEGTQLKSAFAAIDRKQEAADVRKALDEAISNAQGSKTRIREAYDMTYDYKNQGKATGAVDTSNPLLK
jgi:hypothetical protein